MQYISELKANDSRRLSLRAIEEETGISHSRVSDLLNGRMGSPSLQEFVTLCLLFGHRPSKVMEEVMQSLDNTTSNENPDKLKLVPADERPVDDDERVRLTLEKLHRGDMDIVALEDEHKFDGDGDDSA